MLLLKILWIMIGVLFVGFGYFICIKKKYNLVNNFEYDKSINIYDDAYARRVGLIELIGGLVCILFGTVSLFLNSIFTIVLFLASVFGIIFFLIANMVKSNKRKRNILRP